MSENKENQTLFKAIANQKRFEIYNYIIENDLLIKPDILEHFKLQRAGLDFHLSSLAEAGLIELKNVKIKNRKYVLVYAKSKIKIDLLPLNLKDAINIIPENLSENNYIDLIERIWINNEDLGREKIGNLLEKLVERLDLDPLKYTCFLCRNKISTMKCTECEKFICFDCAKIIQKKEDKIILCDECITEKFS